MKKIINLLCCTALFLGLGACSQTAEEENDFGTPRENEIAVRVSLPTSIPIRDVGITYDKEPGKDPNTGKITDIYRYVWGNDRDQTLFLFFKDNKNQVGINNVRFKVPLSYNKSGDAGDLILNLPVPSHMKAEDVVSISGAMGVHEQNNIGDFFFKPIQGQLYTHTPRVTPGTQSDEFEMPLYFVTTPVKNKRVDIHLKTYGTLLRIVLQHNDLHGAAPTTWSKLHVKTSLFATSGKFNIKDITGEPVFVPIIEGKEELVPTANGEVKYKYLSSHEFNLQNYVATKDKPAYFYVWGFPNDEIPDETNTDDDRNTSYQRAVFIDVTEKGSSITGPDQTYHFYKAAKGAWKKKNAVYSMSVKPHITPLIITEMIHESTTVSYYEIYNPEPESVNLEGYYLFDALLNQWVSLTDARLVNVNSENATEGVNTLPGKRTLVIASSGGSDNPDNLALRGYWHTGLGATVFSPSVSDWYKKIPVSWGDGRPDSRFGHFPALGRKYIAYKAKDDNNQEYIVLGDVLDLNPDDASISISAGSGIIRQPLYNTPRSTMVPSEWAAYATPGGVNYNANLGARWYEKGREPGIINYTWGKDPRLGDNDLVDPD